MKNIFKNASKKTKILAISFGVISVSAATAIAIPLSLKKNNEFENIVKYDGKLFHSKNELVEYIKKDSDEEYKLVGSKIFTISIGNDVQKYDKYSDAYNYVLKKLKPVEIYRKKNFTQDKDTDTISPESFVKVSDIAKFIAFRKYSSEERFSPTGNEYGQHDFTFAPAINENDSEAVKKLKQTNINKARDEAARSYIQVHSAYKFDNKYFRTKNDVKSYIVTNWGNRGNFDSDKTPKKLGRALALSNGSTIYFDNNGGADENGIWKANPDFIHKVAQNATPYLKYQDFHGDYHYAKISGDTKKNVKSGINTNALDYIKINSNNDKVTEIVDMNGSTPNGNIYGPYYVTSGQGMSGIKDVKNWEEISDKTTLPSRSELIDISILKSVINYIVKTQGFSTFLEFFKIAKIEDGGETFFEYLNKKNNFKEDYVNSVYEMAKTLAQGVRNNHLDNIIAIHAFLINKMLKNNENVEKIIKVARYFDSIMKLFDYILGGFLAPFFTKDSSRGTMDTDDYQINYFQSVFHFYGDGPGKDINFQNNPYSYYRKLIGKDQGKENKNTDEEIPRHRNIFLLIEAMMGIHGISMNGLRHNQKVFNDWAEKYQQNLEFKNASSSSSFPTFPSTSFSTKKKDGFFWDFSFKGKDEASGIAKNSIWSNISKVSGDITFGDHHFTREIVESNISYYLLEMQNAYIKDYKNKLKKTQQELKNTYEKDTIMKKPNGEELINKPHKYERNKDEKSFKVNTINFIDINTSDVFANHPTTNDAFDHLKKMVNSAVIPLDDRIVDFGTKVGTFAAKVAIAIATAGVGAEASMIEESMSFMGKETFTVSQMGKMTNKGFTSFSRSVTYEKTFSRTRKIKMSNSKNKTLFDKLDSEISWPTGTKPEDKKDLENIIADSFGDVYSFGNETLGRIIKIGMKIGIGIIKNVIPFVGAIFDIFNSFNSSERQVYRYSQAEDGTDLYWDGGLVNYSWWGLSADQVYKISDLKMIDPQEIISGWSQNSYYYGKKRYDSLEDLRNFEADKLIKKVSHFDITILKNDSATRILKNNGLSNVFWKVDIKNLKDDGSGSHSPYFQNIDDLVNYVKKFGSSEIAKDVYKTAGGLISTSSQGNAIQEDTIKSVLNSLKTVLILKLPNIVNNETEVDHDFKLPYPFWNSGKIISAQNDVKNANKKYIIFNPNINMNSKWFEKLNINPKLRKAINEMNLEEYASKTNKLNKLLKVYSDKIFVPEKRIEFRELNSRNSDTFEKLDSSWSEKKYTVYSFINTVGHKLYYENRGTAIKELLSSSNYKLVSNTLGRVTKIYRFNGSIFNSINQIYEYIINHQGEKNEK